MAKLKLIQTSNTILVIFSIIFLIALVYILIRMWLITKGGNKTLLWMILFMNLCMFCKMISFWLTAYYADASIQGNKNLYYYL